MGLMFLLDSVILIDHFNDVSEATDFIKKNADQLAISVITRSEVLVGFTEAEQFTAKLLLDKFQTLEISGAIADLAAKLRQKRKWKLPDAFQAALAQHHNFTLVTRNTKDFNPNTNDFVLCPYKT